jgi:hypothetical protein
VSEREANVVGKFHLGWFLNFVAVPEWPRLGLTRQGYTAPMLGDHLREF